MNATYDVVWPRSAQGVQSQRLAPRLSSLDGKRVAFLWDYMFRGDELFPVIERELKAAHPGLAVVGYDEFGNTHGPNEAEVVAGLAAKLDALQIDAVVSGVGC